MHVVNYTTFIKGSRIDSTMTVGQWTILITEHCTLPSVTGDTLRNRMCRHGRFIQLLLTCTTIVMVAIKEAVSLSELYTCFNRRRTRRSYRILILIITVEIATQPIDFGLVVWVQFNKNSGIPIEHDMHSKVRFQ